MAEAPDSAVVTSYPSRKRSLPSQDRRVWSSSTTRIRAEDTSSDLPLQQGEAQQEASPASGNVLRPDAPPVLPDDAVADGEPQTSPLAHLLGGEEGLADALAVLYRDAGT